jgi:hypothetical protein
MNTSHLPSSVSSATALANSLSLSIIDFLNKVKDQLAGFRALAHDFLGIARILDALEERLKEHSSSTQPFPKRAVPELNRIISKTLADFDALHTLLNKFIDYERRGAIGKLQKTWRMFFADKDIAKVQLSLHENKGALNMTMLLVNM